MSRKISGNSVIWLLCLPLMLFVIFYLLDSDGRNKLLQLVTMFWGWASFHLLFKMVSARLQSKAASKETMRRKDGFVIPKTYVYIAVIASVFLFFSFMNYLSRALLLTIVIIEFLHMMVRLILDRIKKSRTVERENGR